VKSTSHLTLMRYFDGELTPEEAAEVERQLQRDPAARRVADDLDLLGDVVRNAALERAAAHDDLIDSVMARLDAETPEARAEVRQLPTSLDAARTRRGPVTGRSPVKVAALVGVSLALAAGAALVLRTSRPETTELVSQRPGASVLVPDELAARGPHELAAGAADAAELAISESSASASIETVDFGSSAGTIFLAGEEDGQETTPVVWVMDEPGPSPGRMEPL
jgi:negative regulator of sigma E activity